MDTEQRVFGITRPHSSLMKLYAIRAILTLPLAPILLPFYWFRYKTLHYRFDGEGVSMGWGILFRKEIHLTYARIQDIHLSSGFIQRWLGLADLQIQTASGSAAAEMTIEGLREHEMVRDFLYERMRGLKSPGARRRSRSAASEGEAPGLEGDAESQQYSSTETVALLREMAADLRAARQALESGRD